MKSWSLFVIILYTISSCNNPSTSTSEDDVIQIPEVKDSMENRNFFPVTNYFRGQLIEMGQMGKNPIKYVARGKHIDSNWVKIEDLQKELAEFLTPEIDSNNLISLFKETKFMDQTIDAITFSYDPVKELPDSLTLRHWDVYVDPLKHTVRRVYMLKDINGKKLHLTWQSGKWCKIIEMDETDKSKPPVEKEVFINWDY